MNACGNGKFFSSVAGLQFRVGKQRVMEQGRCFSGYRIQHLMVNFAEAAGANLAVEIEKAEKAVWFSRGDVFSQGDAIDAPKWSWP